MQYPTQTKYSIYHFYFLTFQGVSYNHIELNFYINGQNLECPFTNVKGNVYPAVYGELR